LHRQRHHGLQYLANGDGRRIRIQGSDTECGAAGTQHQYRKQRGDVSRVMFEGVGCPCQELFAGGLQTVFQC
jgi:hypothetical protein